MIPNKSLKRTIEDDEICKRHFGLVMAKKIKLRMNALTAAESLSDFWLPNRGPERCHKLKGDLAGIFSMDLEHPYRLLFKAAEELSEAENEKQLCQMIKSIEIIRIEDTHD